MLDRQTITMPFGQGVDTKTDPKQVVAGKLLELENGVFTTLKALRKRDGNVALGNQILGSSQSVINGSGLATFGSELLIGDGSSIYSYNESENNWNSKGPFFSTQVTKNSIVQDSYNQSRPDGAIASNGLQLFAWQDSSGANTIRYCIIDSATEQTVVASTLLTSAGIKPRVIAGDGVFAIYFVETSPVRLSVATLPITSPLAPPVITPLTGTSGGTNALDTSTPIFDALRINDTLAGDVVFVAFSNGNTSGAGESTLRAYSASGITTTVLPQATFPYRMRSLSMFPVTITVGIGDVAVAFSTDADIAPYTTSVRYVAFQVTSSNLLSSADQLIQGGLATISAFTITAAAPDTSQSYFEVYWSNPSSVGTGVVKATVTNISTIAIDSSWRKGVVLFARVFSCNNELFVPVVYNSTLQSTYFIISGGGNIIAKALPGTAGPSPIGYGGRSYPVLASSSTVDVDTFLLPCTETANLGGAGFNTGTGVSSLTIDIDEPVHSFAHETLGKNLHFTGGFVQMYDGVNVVEHGFHLYPENINRAVGTSGSMGPGTYQYSVCYEWRDQQNNIHRSRPSQTLVEAIIPAGPSNGSVELFIPYLQLTDKVGDRPVQIVVYRTTAGDSVFYRVSSLTSPSTNVVGGALTLSFTDTLNDTSLVQNNTAARPLLYNQWLVALNTGQLPVVANDPAPPAKLIQLHRNRLWVVDSTNPLQLWYSKQVTVDAPVEFSDEFVKQIDPRGGPISALATMDDKLLVFKDSRIFFVAGQGPTDTGEQDDLSDAIQITTDVGCIDPRSVVGTPVGVMFQSSKGIYLIDRSLAVSYVGAPVEAYNNETVTSALLLNDKNQVRFTLGNGKTLVFDYFVQQWGVFTGQYSFDTIIWQGAPVMLRTNGRVLKETPGVWTDAGSPYSLKLATSWLSFTNVQGFQRVRRAQILGQWYSPHNLQVDCCVDFDDTIVQSAVVQPTTPSVFGGVSPYGSGSYGGTLQLYQWRIDLARQKTQAVKFIIQDLPTATAGEGMSLSSIAFEVGAKKGLNKVPAGQIFS